MYEVVPAGQKIENEGVDALRYGKVQTSDTNFIDELLTVKLRYKEPDGEVSKLITTGLIDKGNSMENASENLKFAVAVAEFGLFLRNSRYKGDGNFSDSLLLAESSLGTDLKNYRGDFLNLVKKAGKLQK